MAKVAVVLSGCGVNDGSEIHEAVLTLLALDKQGVDVQCLAPDLPQMHVVDHIEGEPQEGETRNVLVESARIARGDIKAINSVSANEFDAVVFPGGFGVAKNLCDYAVEGTDCTVNPDVENFINDAYESSIPLGFICISPVLGAKVLGEKADDLKLTIGNDSATASDVEEFGAAHVDCPVNDCVIDKNNRVISTPAYMLGPGIKDVDRGIEKLVQEVVIMASG
ncbi:MAG TPA: isoprenoid biosynthesis glyoxalase ElbB [bacterium]|nr:isoprenoid biosynthesis glyoxalase ElbB [bacterium]